MSRPFILVTGPTGTVGSEVVKQLMDAQHKVRVLARDPEKAKKFGNKVEVAKGDLMKPETLIAAFAGVDAVFVLSTGPDTPVMEGNAYAAAKEAGVKHIVKLSGRHIDADFMAPTPLAKWHTHSERALRLLGLDWTILRPGTFASNFQFWLDRKQGAFFLPVGDGKDVFIDPRDIAAVAVKALTTPGHGGRIYEITGSGWLDYSQAAQKISKATGNPVKFVDVPELAAREGMLASGIPQPYVDSMLGFFTGIKTGKIFAPTSVVEDLLGHPARSFDDWVKDNVTSLR